MQTNDIERNKRKLRKKSSVILVNQKTIPEASDIYISPLYMELANFISKVQFAFVNKLVSMTFADRKAVFMFGIFEMIQGRSLKITASSSQYYIKQLTDKSAIPSGFENFVARTKPISMNHEKNLSANLIRQCIFDHSHGIAPKVEFIHFATDDRLHPKIKRLISRTMRHAVGIPLFVKNQPIGTLWGIRRRPLNNEQKEEVSRQMISLAEGINIILSEEMENEKDDYSARRKIEKYDTHSCIEHIFYTRGYRQKYPIKSYIAYSNIYKTRFRQDTNYIVPTGVGYNISMKRFLPEELNDTKKIILMIPGFFNNRSLMDRMAREMAQRYGYTCLTLDMRGRSKHTVPNKIIKGYSWSVDDYIWEDFPAALRWIRDSYPDHSVIALGHSMGGMIPRFYASSFESYIRQYRRYDLVHPDEILAGIISITSPSYLNLKWNNSLLDIATEGARLLNNSMILDPLFKVLTFSVASTIGTIDLKKFFAFLHNVSNSMRNISFDMAKVPTLKDFIGYDQITPPEWYFFMEDVFCEESVRVIVQFFRSQLSQDSFKSYDQKINYTENQSNLDIPLFSILGAKDALATPETVKHGFSLARSKKKRLSSYDQGHLGIITDPETIKGIGKESDEWIRSL